MREFHHPRYKSLSDKWHIFETLMVLITKSKFQSKKEISIKIFGFQFLAIDPQTLSQLYNEIFLDQVYFFKSNNSMPQIIDGGANMGLSLIYFKHLYPNSSIIALEPNPKAFYYLKKNVDNNKLKSVKLLQAAFSLSSQKAPFFLSKNILNSSIILGSQKREKILIDVINLSNLLKYDNFDLIKIDIEGVEYEIIGDLIKNKLLGKSNQYIFEFHDFGNPKSEKAIIFKEFKNKGFHKNLRLRIVRNDGLIDEVVHFQKLKHAD